MGIYSKRRRPELTEREISVLAEFAKGRGGKQIAFDLGISTHTVYHHCENARLKLGTTNTMGAINIAREKGLL